MNKLLQPTIIAATIEDYPTIQNMARFYLYDMSRYCASISDEWNIPADGMYQCFDFKNYFLDPMRKAFLVKVGEKLAGFVLLDKEGTSKNLDWNIGEFFILSQFQSKGISKLVAYEIWKTHPGSWRVAVIPENVKALTFWRNIIGDFTNGHYREEIKKVDFDEHQPNRYILTFDTNARPLYSGELKIRKSTIQDIESIILLSYHKRRFYEKAQPQFWKYAGPEAEIKQAKWFEQLRLDESYVMPNCFE